MKLKVGLGWFFINSMPFDPDVLLHYAREADRLGFESISIPEHCAIPHGYATRYPYSETGRLPTDDEAMPFPDPLLPAAFAAAVTTRIKFTQGVMILPQRHPLYTAKEMATLDVLSKGRMMMGIGSGWLKEEFDALGIDFHTRGARTNECIEAIRILWRDDPATYIGKHIRFENMRSFPKPVQKTIPIHVGGISDPAIRRTARYGDGFLPVPTDDVASLYRKLKAECDRIGRNFNEIELTYPGASTLDEARRAQDLGVSRVSAGIFFSRDLDQITRDLEKIANDLLAKL
jgi:probable F420-dependent oxidoreductase